MSGRRDGLRRALYSALSTMMDTQDAPQRRQALACLASVCQLDAKLGAELLCLSGEATAIKDGGAGGGQGGSPEGMPDMAKLAEAAKRAAEVMRKKKEEEESETPRFVEMDSDEEEDKNNGAEAGSSSSGGGVEARVGVEENVVFANTVLAAEYEEDDDARCAAALGTLSLPCPHLSVLCVCLQLTLLCFLL